MTEPVAWRVKNKGGMDWQLLPFTPRGHYDFIEPLYTAEQLHPRVKMTQDEFDDWKELYQSNTLFSSAMALLDDDKYVEKYNVLYMKIYTGEDEQNIYNEAVFAELWAEYNPDNPEETIEIAPDMKWFVERNDTSDDHRFLSKNVINLDNELNYAALKKSAKKFDTKEEAEKWTNPLTEAVQLPVEGE